MMRLSAFFTCIQWMQPGKCPQCPKCSWSCRFVKESANTLAADAVVVPEAIERALLMRSLEPSLAAELMRKVGWWDKSVADLIIEVTAVDKAKRSSSAQRAKPLALSRTKSQYLSVAAGKQRTSGEKGKEKRSTPEALAAATATQGRRNGKNSEAGRAQQQQFTPSTKDMQKYYSPEQWARRTVPVAGRRPQNDPLGKDKDLFDKDVDPETGRPWCVKCRKTGHTLSACPVLQSERSNKRKVSHGAQQSNNRPRR